jgi:DNA-binding Lrp family transcriptional regulator
MIDKTEEKIVRMLLNDARTSLTHMAKECGISVPSVNSRIAHLKKKEIINGAIMQINPKRLGFTCCGVLQIIASPNKEKIVRKYLADKKFIFYDNKLLSRSLFGVFFALPYIDGLSRMIEQMKNHPDIDDVNPIIWNDVNKIEFPENLILSSPTNLLESKEGNIDLSYSINSKKDDLILQNNFKPVVFDKIDLRITKILTERARIPFSKIAKQIGISPNNVISRYKQLRKENVLSDSSITINLKKLDYKAIAVIFLKASSSSNASKLYKQIINKSNVIVAIRLLGPFDVMIDIPVKSFAEVFDLKEKLLEIEGIQNILTELHGPFEKWPLNIFAPFLKKYEKKNN